jgi:alpha-tubulin suppressor-like RCC1 family protein
LSVSRLLTALALLFGSIAVAALPSAAAGADLSVVAIAPGGNHTCAITTGGGVKCWGWNPDGQLGDGTTTTRLTPVDVVGLGSGVVALAAGGADTCALTSGGAVKCWGAADLGDGTSNASSVPVDVVGLGSGVAAITPGCALTTGGAVKCWGDNTFGQLGTGNTSTSITPVTVSGLGSGVAAISSGNAHTCALLTGGTVKCWGYNAYGALGDGTTTTRLAPVDVVGLGSDVIEVSTEGDHTCAITTGDGTQCWGRNDYGQLGDGTRIDRHTPVAVVALSSGIASISAGGFHTCALTTGGGVLCWGRNEWGAVGDGTTDGASEPVGVAGLDSGVLSVVAGGDATCALTVDSSMLCWGYGGEGELGVGTANNVVTPVDVDGMSSGVASIANGYHHSCAIADGGELMCWGDNESGQVGDGTTLERDRPVEVIASAVVAVTAGYDHTCALSTGGAVSCWGNDTNGQLGDGGTSDRHSPIGVSGLGSGVVAISAGAYHTCALTTTGVVKCWGRNHEGQIGDGTETDAYVPVTVAGLGAGVQSVDAGAEHTCAVTASGAAKCWGDNDGGDLGDGTGVRRHSPVGVVGLGSGVAAISGGASYTCAVTTGGALKCWGDNGSGQLGDGTTTPVSTPVGVTGFGSGTAAVDAGASSTCALTTGGALKCWGDNGHGGLGDGTTTDRATPVTVTGLGSGVASFSAEGDHTCAVTTAGAAQCWGYNQRGQLGDGSAGFSSVPIGVFGLGLEGATTPEAPDLLSTAAADGAANASWAPPVDDGGAPVYGYIVRVTSAAGGTASGVTGSRTRTTFTASIASLGADVGTSTATSAFHFTGLSNGTGYRLDIAPLNRAGIGASALSSVVRPGTSPPTPNPPPTPSGYWMVGSSGNVYAFGHVGYFGNASTTAVTHIEPTPSRHGYWIVDAAGSVFAFGDAHFLSPADPLAPGEFVTSLSSTPTGRGYWLFTNRGRAMSRGDAPFLGDMRAATLNGGIVGSVATPTGKGYYMVGSDGGVFSFGDARFHGSMGGAHLNQPVIALVPTANNHGYWLVASDGGIFSFGAPFRGSMGGTVLNRSVVGMIRYGNGYLMVASDGGVFDFSNLPFRGSLAAHPPQPPIVSAAATG